MLRRTTPTLLPTLLLIRSMATVSSARLRAVLLNADRIDFDQRLDWARLSAVADISRHGASEPSEVAARVADHEIVINKEMPLPASLIDAFPPSVKLICEAGTGYNNVDTAAARARGITVCNIPTYSTDAMAQMAITFVMSLSCSLVPQAKAMATGDRAHIERCHLGSWPHFELTGKTIGLVGGLGTIGTRVATIAQALGMRVLASSRSAAPGVRDDGIEVAPLEELLRRSDFVSIQCAAAAAAATAVASPP